jgi:phosphoglycolate phosphatase
MRKSVFFDLDGTLTDSSVGIVNCISYALTELGAALPPPSRLKKYIGMPLREVFADLLGNAGAEKVEKAVGLYRKRFETDGMYENALYPGIVDLLAGIRKGGWRAYVVTSKSEYYARPIVVHLSLQQFFAGVFGSELDGTRAHKKELISYVLEKESIRPTDAVMVGDRHNDVSGALSNGLPALGVTYGYGSREELADAGATWVCDNPACVLATLSAHFEATHGEPRNEGKED